MSQLTGNFNVDIKGLNAAEILAAADTFKGHHPEAHAALTEAASVIRSL